MKKLTHLVKLLVFKSFIFIGLASSLYAQQAVSPVITIDNEDPEIANISLAPQIETITITPDLLLPEEAAGYESSVVVFEKPKRHPLVRAFQTVFLFGWYRDAQDWFYTKPKRKESKKEKKIREEWETMLGRDYFYAYYKFEEASKTIREKTTFQKGKTKYRLKTKKLEAKFPTAYSFEGIATYEFWDQDVKVKFKKKFG